MGSIAILLVAALVVGPETPRSSPGTGTGTDRPLAVAGLREQLFNRQDPPGQSQAALLLVQDPSAEAASIVREALARWDRPDVVLALASAVRLQRDGRFVEPLLKALHSEQANLRSAAAETLARLDGPGLIQKLHGLAEEPTAGVPARQAAIAALGKTGHKAAVPALLSLLTSDLPALRQAAAAALEELTGLDHGSNIAAWQAWWSRHKDLDDATWLSSRNALFVERTRRLQSDLQRAETEILRLQQQLYARTPRADRVSHFRQLAQNEYPIVRAQAVAWIVETLAEAQASETKSLCDLLLTFSEDGVEAVQRQAVLALEKVDDPRARERLLHLLRQGSAEVRAAAARSLGRYRAADKDGGADAATPQVIAALQDALGDPSLAVVGEAAESLGTLGARQAAPLVAGLLRHPADSVRQAAARALERLPDPALLETLDAACADPVPGVRFHAVGALGRLGQADNLDPKQRTHLLRRLEQVLVHDGDPGVRSRAATVLGDLGSAAQLPVLWERVTATEDARVQVKAWAAFVDILARLGNWSLLQQWDQTLSKQQEHTRRIELLLEIRSRWARNEATRPQVDAVTATLIQALLVLKKWNQAAPLVLEQVRRAPSEAELQRRLRWLVAVGSQALEEGKPQETLRLLREVEDLMPGLGGDLGAEFDLLRQRAHRLLNQP
jgi:HEAT repeat protein